MDFLDCDRNLEKQTGASVNLIFDVEGESGFRERESKMLKILTSRQNLLLATGGGTVLKKENRELLKRTGLVVYLQTSVSQQLQRLRLDRTRPLLQKGDRKQKLTRLGRPGLPFPEPWPEDHCTTPGRGHPFTLGRIFVTGHGDRPSHGTV
jgi:shikimate kinase